MENASLLLRNGSNYEEDLDSSDAMIAKYVAMAVLFSISFVLGTSPIALSNVKRIKLTDKNNENVKMVLCFGGGVLFCTTFLHLLPEVTHNIHIMNVLNNKFPVAGILTCTGFFGIYLVEVLVHMYIKKYQNTISKVETPKTVDSESGKNGIKQYYVHDKDQQHKHCDGHNHDDYLHIPLNDNFLKSIQGLLVILALSVHELFEGLSIGLENSPSAVWYMFGAVSVHKFVIAFCIGMELLSGGIRPKILTLYVFIFAIVSPIGIGIGIAVTNINVDKTELASVILQGFATGTLMYVVFFEILREERRSGIKEYLAFFLGFGLMTLVTLLS